MPGLDYIMPIGAGLVIYLGLPLAVLNWRRIARMLGFKVHVFKVIHRSGFTRKCKHCGEEQQMYSLYVSGDPNDWWETSCSGDGSCHEPELSRRWEWY